MVKDGNNILREKVLSTQYAANIEVLNVTGININYNLTDWFNVFLPI